MDTHILKRLDEHILEAHRHLCQSVDGGIFEQADEWARSFTGSTISTFNLLLLLGNRALTDDLLSDTAAYFNEQGVPHVVAFDEHWFSGGTNFLHSRSYQPLPPLPGMVLLGPPRRLRGHPDLVIEQVGTKARLGVYCKLISELFGLPLPETAQKPLSVGCSMILLILQGVAQSWTQTLHNCLVIPTLRLATLCLRNQDNFE